MIDLSTAKNPAVFVSGGIDSMLVLSMARETCPDVDVYCFNQNFTREQWSVMENLIKEWDLEVRSFPPMNSYIVPNGKVLAQVSEYNLNGVVVPILRDYIDGPMCSLDLDKTRCSTYPFDHDVVLVGSRKEDNSFATGQPFSRDEIELGGIRFIAPLFDWTADEVLAEAQRRKLPYSRELYENGDESRDSGNIVACTRCLNSKETTVYCPKEQDRILTYQWDRSEALSTFREKFGFVSTKEQHYEPKHME